MQLKSLVKLMLIGILLAATTTAAQAGSKEAGSKQADWTTTLNVKLALLDKLGADSLHVDVDSMAGTVTLAGTVDKRETLELAETVAKSVAGVEHVDNNLHLEAALANPSRVGATVNEADAEVKDAVLETRLRLALIDKMGRDGFRIGTDAASGVVTLSFERGFKSHTRREAVAIATAMAGVSKVVSVDKT